MRLVKAVLAYDGTHFSGWQIQTNAHTVQAALAKALERIHGRPVKVTAASRTDGGVHAEGQVVHFQTDSALSDAKLRIAINFNLPPTVAVRSLKTQSRPFHARFDAVSKLYRYVIYTGRTKPVFDRDRVWWLPFRLDVRAMRKAARALVGKHDFTSFSGPDKDARSRVRTIRRITVARRGDRIVIEVLGDGFLYNMVRIIAGTLVHAGFGKIAPERVAQILAARDRKLAGPTAEAKGLTLVRVGYRGAVTTARRKG